MQLHDILEKHHQIQIHAPHGSGKRLFAERFLRSRQQHYRHLFYCTLSHAHSLLHALLDDYRQLNYLGSTSVESLPTLFGKRYIAKLQSLPGPNLLLLDGAHSQLAATDQLLLHKSGPSWSVIALVEEADTLKGFSNLPLPELSILQKLRLFENIYGRQLDESLLKSELKRQSYSFTNIIELAKAAQASDNALSEFLRLHRDKTEFN